MLSSIFSSDKSIICELKIGFPVNLKFFSLSLINPSIHGNNFLAAWSVWRITVAPYNLLNSWTCLAPEIAPFIAADWSLLSKLLPALKIAPPFENWIITGEFNLDAVSRVALIELDPITFTAGIANLFALACLNKSWTSLPVNTMCTID